MLQCLFPSHGSFTTHVRYKNIECNTDGIVWIEQGVEVAFMLAYNPSDI